MLSTPILLSQRTAHIVRPLLLSAFSTSPSYSSTSVIESRGGGTLLERSQQPLLRRLVRFNKTMCSIRTGYFLYDHCKAQSRKFAATQRLPQTFHTYFVTHLLHVWMVLLRLRRIPSGDGGPLSQEMFSHFWKHVDDQMQVMGNIDNPLVLGRDLKRYSKIYYGSVLRYDLALRQPESDAWLADALWRNVLSGGSEGDDGAVASLQEIAAAVEYVRQQIALLHEEVLDEELLDGLIPPWADATLEERSSPGQ